MAVVRLPIFGTYSTRPGGTTSKDSRYKNAFFEIVESARLKGGQDRDDTTYYICKRPGLKADTDHSDANEGRGCYGWKGNKYVVIGNSIYKNGSELGTNALTNTSGKVYFTEEHKTDILVIQDNDKIITVTTGDTVTELTDPHIPTNQVPGIISLDTYVMVMNTDGEIYNSNVDDVTNWESGDFLTALIEPDDGVALAKHRNYALALGEWTTEVFFDAANPEGSPLDPAEGTVHHVGCAAGNTVFADEDTVVWVGQTRDGGVQVVALDGLQLITLSNPHIERLIDAEGSNLVNASAFGMRWAGHLFYVLRLNSQTLVCDIGTKLWSEWTVYNGSTEEAFTQIDTCSVGDKVFTLDEDNGKLYEFSLSTYQDDSQKMLFEVVTDKLDFSTTQNKFLNRLSVIGDQQTSTSNLTVEWTNDDYQNFSSARTLDMSTTAPTLYGGGMFQRRGFRLKHEANTPLRLEAIEFDIELGDFMGGNS